MQGHWSRGKAQCTCPSVLYQDEKRPFLFFSVLLTFPIFLHLRKSSNKRSSSGKKCIHFILQLIFNSYAFESYKTRCSNEYCSNMKFNFQKQPTRGVPKKGVLKTCSKFTGEYPCREYPYPCDFNKVALQSYWNQTSAWVCSCKFAAYFHNTFL